MSQSQNFNIRFWLSDIISIVIIISIVFFSELLELNLVIDLTSCTKCVLCSLSCYEV